MDLSGGKAGLVAFLNLFFNFPGVYSLDFFWGTFLLKRTFWEEVEGLLARLVPRVISILGGLKGSLFRKFSIPGYGL